MASVATIEKAVAEKFAAGEQSAALEMILATTQALREENRKLTLEARETAEVKITEHGLTPTNIEGIYRIAKLIASSSLVPVHLRCVKGKEGDDLPFDVVVANCFRVVNQAMRWGFDPFAIIDETYMARGKLGYQGKLIAAVVNARGGLSQRLNYSFNDAKGDALEVTVAGTLKGESAPRTATLKVGDAKTDNQMWTRDPWQKLIYSGVTKWARRHCPEVVLGVLSDDDVDRINAGKEPATGNTLADLMGQTAAEAMTAAARAKGDIAANETITTTGEIVTEKPVALDKTESQVDPVVDKLQAQQAAAKGDWRTTPIDDVTVKSSLGPRIVSLLKAKKIFQLGDLEKLVIAEDLESLKMEPADALKAANYVQAKMDGQ